jgi:ribonuclease Z
MRITLLGTGCPAVHPRRLGAAQLIEGGGARLLVDCGSGCTQRLVEAGHSPATPDALLVTHLHSDHLVDLWQLTVAGWHAGRARPLRLYAPPPVLAHARALEAAWAEERAQRLAWEARPNPDGFALELIAIEPGQTLHFGELRVTVIEVDHRPVAPALGFLFADGHHRLAFSGDTRRCPGLIEAARDCDLLVHEVFAHGVMQPREGVRSAATIRAVEAYHTTATEVGALAAEAGARALLLTHIVPPDVPPERLLADVRAHYAGPVIVGEDLVTVDLATLTVRWRGMVTGLSRL